jgi:PII-like signaling protein
MELLEKGHLLRLFIGESDRHKGELLYEWLVKTAREEGLAGATVLRGMMGFGPTSRIRTSKILELSQDLPVVIEIVDTSDRLEAFLEKVGEAIPCGMATLERVDVKFYRSSSRQNNESA